jgi:hypothetical protein
VLHEKGGEAAAAKSLEDYRTWEHQRATLLERG